MRADRLAEELGLGEVWLKNDTRNPTNSFKDRVTSVALSKALEFGFKTVACASTGNLANSVAAHAAHAGLRSYVFIPSDLEAGKIVTTSVYGGNVVAVRGNYDDVNRLCAELASTYEWAFVNVNMRPFYAEGSKTLAFETAEQLGWQTPDHVVVPVASGSLLTKIHKGFHELYRVGLLDSEPQVRVSGAQAEGCSPVARAFAEGSDTIRPVKPSTIAKSLAIGNPADGYFALDTVRDTGGGFAAVTDDEIVEGMRLLARTEGVFGETAAGVDGRHACAPRARRSRPTRRAGRRLHHRARAEDARRGRTGRRSDGDDRADPRRLPRVVHGRGAVMSVTVRIPTQLRSLTGGASEVAVEGGTVAEILKQLDAEHPGFGERIFDESGALRRFVNVFVADEDIRFLAEPRHARQRGSGRQHRPRRRRRLKTLLFGRARRLALLDAGWE